MLATPIRIAWGFIKAMLVVLFVAVVLLFFGVARAGCADFICPGETRNIVVPSDTGIGGRVIGNIYNPGPGRRLQIRRGFMDNRIRAYIDKSTGAITNPDTRQEIGRIDGIN